MITPQNISQVRAFARQDGAFLSLLWIGGFLSTMWAAKMPLLAPLGNLVVIATPFFVAFRLKKFRDDALEGVISFRRGFLYSIETFFHAAMILAVVQYLYFRYGDISGFLEQWNASYSMAAQVYHLNGTETKELQDAVGMMGPLAWTSMFLILELIAGLVVSPIIAAVMARRTPRRGLHSENP